MALITRSAVTGSAAGGLFLAALLLRPFLFGPAAPSEQGGRQERSGARSTPDTRTQKQTGGAWREDGPWQASRRHFAGLLAEDQCPSLDSASEGREVAAIDGVALALRKKAGQSAAIDDPRSRVWCIPPDKVRVRAMIAIVPDPVHSRLSLAYDRTIEALQNAAEASNFVSDRYWLPWRAEMPAATDASPANDDQPGLLLFRGNGPHDDVASLGEVLYVFLVADTSTAGINGAQFRNAVRYIQQVCGRPGVPSLGCGPDSRVWIMGPTFSGSLSSLRNLTDSLSESSSPAGSLNFSGYSGTVSSLCALANQGLVDPEISNETVKQRCGPAPPVPYARHLVLRSMVGDSETTVAEFLHLLEEQGHIHCGGFPEVAILSEAATTYGGAVAASGRLGKGKGEAGANCAPARFRYPREISTLRNATAAIQRSPAPQPSPAVSQSPSSLPFTLADQSNASDEPQDFAHIQGPLSKEAVLMKYAAEIRRGRYKFVGIIGTNVVDVLFLARFLRDACPDVRLFIFNSDLLLERDVDNAPYIGMLSISTYPIVGRNLGWLYPDVPPGYLPFADQYQEGQFNAFYAVIQGASGSSEPPANPQTPMSGPPYETKAPFARSLPLPPGKSLPVWITSVGSGGYWPIQLMHRREGEDDPASMARSFESYDFSPSWRTLALLLSAFAFLYAWVLRTANPIFSRFRDLAVNNVAPAQRFFFINAGCSSMALALALFSIPALKFGNQAGSYVPFVVSLMIIAMGVLPMPCVRSGLWLAKCCCNQMASRRECVRSFAASAVLWLVAAVVAVGWWRLHGDDPSHYGFFFGYRAINLGTGLSPLAPMLLLLAAVFLWSVFEVLRLRFDDQVRARINPAGRASGGESEKSIADAVNKYWLHPNYLAAFVLIFGAWLFSLGFPKPFHLLERKTFDYIFVFLFCLVVALMLTSSLRLAQTWSALHKLLRELERSPIRHTFRRLKETAWSPIWQAGGQEAEWTNMARSFEAMEQISVCEPVPEGGLAEHIDAALEERRKMREQIASQDMRSLAGTRALQEGFSGLQHSFAVVFNDIMVRIQGHWSGVCCDSGESGGSGEESVRVIVHCCEKEPPDPKEKSLARMEEYVALRYVTFIRSVLGHIRFWLILQASVFTLVLASLNVYSFEPHRSLVWSLTAIFVVIGVNATQVLVQAHKNHIISYISGTKPNHLEWQFFVRLVTLGALPLFTLLATHFPSIGHYLSSFFQPGLEALK